MSQPIPAAEPAPLSGLKLALAAIAISLGFFLVVLDITIANVAVPHIAGALGASPTQGTWIITSYAVAEAICVPLTGWLAKRFGSLRTFTFGLGGFVISSALCGMAPTLGALILFRVLQGICGAPLLPLAQVLLLRIFPKNKAGLAMSISAMTAIMAPLTGPILGGYITDNLSWRWVFYLNIPIAAICMVMANRLLAPFETPRVFQRIDKVGLALLAVWVGALQLMLDMGREHSWFESPLIISFAIIAAVGFAAFLIWELNDDQPIVDLHVLRHRGFWSGTLCISVGYASVMATIVLIPLWSQTVMGYTATWAGMILAPVGLLSMLFAPIAGRLVNKVDPRYTVYWGLMWLAVLTLARAQIYTTNLSPFWIALPQLLQGLSTAFFMVGLTVVALGSVKPNEVASAAGLMAFTRLLSSAALVSLTTTMWDNGMPDARTVMAGTLQGGEALMGQLGAAGFSTMEARIVLERIIDQQGNTVALNHVFTVVGLACVLAAQLTWLLPKRKKPTESLTTADAH